MKRFTFFLILSVLMPLWFVIPTSCYAQGPAGRVEAPAFLSPGDTVALISPSYAVDDSSVVAASDILRSWGFEVVVGPNVGKMHLGRYAGTLQERLSDVRWALGDPAVKAVICNRGGYGSIHMVDRLLTDELSASPKWIVGYSDITTFLGMETLAGVMSIHGTMGSHIAQGGEDETSTLLRDLLLGTVPRYKVAPHPDNRMGHATGILVGGNLSTFAPLLGTSADATALEDIVLFVEEVGESMHNIDRLFNELQFSGALSRCRAVVLGEFTDSGSEFENRSVEQMLLEYLSGYGIPVLCGFPSGHDTVNLPLVMGSTVTVDVTPEGGTLSFGLGGREVTVDTAPIMQRDSLMKAEALAEKLRQEALRPACKCGPSCTCAK